MRKANHLADEKSPYLQQHAHNPVDWYPWGEPAFARARAEGKPVFLSIGYSTCHWCHVMEKESFEDERVAQLLNADFIPIKVDREERPDVDRIYMTAMQAMGLGGGWPLNVFLTPTLAPFYGGTYFPPETIHDRIGMLDLLPQVAKAWREDPRGLESNGSQLLGALAGLAKAEAQAEAAPFESLFTRAFEALETSCDRTWGGFGRAPKFPTVVNLNFLAREAMRVAGSDPSRAASARAMARLQLDAMRAGGIHDHLGGGFHRYSVDARWLVPHFEKMLYDQAQLACAYLDVFQLDGQGADAAIARGVFDYVARDLTGAHGAFLSAEDADSEGEEGRFYAWTPAALRDVLGEEDAHLFARRYGVTEDGNFEHGTSVLHEAETLGAAAAAFGIEPGAAAARFADARARLFEAREKRPRPHKDDKVIVSWNGLMISAFARGAGVLGDRTLAERAERAAIFVWDTLYDEATGALARRWRAGEAGGQGQLDDYAFFARGLIDVFQATYDPVWLERALTLTDEMVARFADDADGAFFESPAGDPSIRVRMKDGFDGAEMAGNSLAALVLLDLAALTARADLREHADRALALYARRLAEHPIAMPQMLVAMARALEPARHVVIVAGKAGAAGEDCAALVTAYHRAFRPHDLLIVVDGAKKRETLARLAPFVAPLVAQGGRATAYVCRDYACRAPVTDPAAFAAALDGD